MNRIRVLRPAALVFALLALATLAAYWTVLRNDFIKFDDGFYLVHNPQVAKGLSWDSLAWAFQTGHQGNWHPVTWISHMLDVQLFGLRPAAHHGINLLFHTANALLLLWLLQRLTGATWRSFFVAALFALHPLHVESVAWASERKDVLSTFFFLLMLLGYAAYAAMPKQRPDATAANSPPLEKTPRLGRNPQTAYALTLVFFGLALMSKPMVVTAPFVLLLLDFWPLRRLEPRVASPDPAHSPWIVYPTALKPLLREKIPFFAMSALCSVITFLVQQHYQAMYLQVPLGRRLSNAAVSYWTYLGQTFLPTRLAIFYPFPEGGPVGGGPWVTVALAAIALIAVSVVALWAHRRAPWFIVGWFWYIGTLVPVIGLVQVGGQAHADRYTYLPLIGIFLCLVWAIAGFASSHKSLRVALAGAGAIVLGVCATMTYAQVSHWRDDFTVFEHALKVTSGNALAHYHVGIAFRDQGRVGEALDQFQATIKADPTFAPAYSELGAILESQGKDSEALALYETALKATPWSEQIHNHLGSRLWTSGQQEAALAHYIAAIRRNPDFADAHFNLGLALSARSQFEEAVTHFTAVCRLRPQDTEALGCLAEAQLKQGRLNQAGQSYRELTRLAPTNAEAHQSLGLILIEQGELGQAMQQFRQAVDLKPNWPDALNALAWVLATHPRPNLRNGPEAVRLAERACEFSEGKQPRFWSTLDVAYAEVGRFPDAIKAASKAKALAESLGQTNAANAAAARIQSYQHQKPYSP
jgi:protein O-mannosyl-transferase